MRARPAPSAARTPISCRRVDARISSRFATFAHAISNTNETAPLKIHSDGLAAATNMSTIGRTSVICVPGFSSAIDGKRASVDSSSRRADWIDVPGDSLATAGPKAKRFGSGRAEFGVQTAAPRGKSNVGGITPINRVRHAVQGDQRAEHRARAAEALPPHVVAQEHDLVVARLFFRRRERTPNGRGYAERAHEIRRYHACADLLRVADASKRHRPRRDVASDANARDGVARNSANV